MDEVSKKEFDALKKEFEHLKKSHGKIIEDTEQLTQIVRDLVQTMREAKEWSPRISEHLRGYYEKAEEVLRKIRENKSRITRLLSFLS
jgi:uncharacterized membrane-anchored protein YhcB (DUF1043 family)